MACSAAQGTLSPTALVYHQDFLLHDAGSGHPERPARLQTIMSRLKESGLIETLVLIEPEPAEIKWLTLVHSPAYLQRLERAAAEAPAELDPDTRVSAHSYRVARLATGGVLLAVDGVMQGRVANAFVVARPPGHHALPTEAMGFCLINHVAVAARYAQERYGLERILIVDWDVHHGNGTQAIFYADPKVMYFSTHQHPYYPGTGSEDESGTGPGKGTTINVPLAAGAGDEEIIRAFRAKLVPAATAFRPQFVFISAGFDAHTKDPLAQLRVTENGYAELTRVVMEIANAFGDGRIVSVLEGGYNLDALAGSVEAHLRVLQDR